MTTQLTYTETVDALGHKFVTVSSANGQVFAANGTISVVGGVISITKTSAAAITLPTPVATTDDNKVIIIVDTTGFLHTVTATANKINGDSSTLTFTGGIGSQVVLVAYQGIWYTLPATAGVLLS